MSLYNLRFEIKTASYDAIIDHLNTCTSYFNPPLNTLVNIEEYGEKIYYNAITFECWKNNELIGLIAVYFNNIKNKIGFITNVSVLKEYQKFGIASKLLSNVIKYGREINYDSIKLEVRENNKTAIKIYERHGFNKINQSGDKIMMELILNNEKNE